jgi:hypothetical protein
MRFLSNIAVNLRATGPAAVLITWIACVTLLGLFGTGPLAKTAIGILSVVGGALVAVLGSQVDKWK